MFSYFVSSDGAANNEQMRIPCGRTAAKTILHFSVDSESGKSVNHLVRRLNEFSEFQTNAKFANFSPTKGDGWERYGLPVCVCVCVSQTPETIHFWLKGVGANAKQLCTMHCMRCFVREISFDWISIVIARSKISINREYWRFEFIIFHSRVKTEDVYRVTLENCSDANWLTRVSRRCRKCWQKYPWHEWHKSNLHLSIV